MREELTLPIGLGLFSVVLAGAILVELTAHPRIDATIVPATASPPAQSAPIAAPAAPVVTELADRPLFTPTRRPAPIIVATSVTMAAPPPPPPPPPPPEPSTQLTLLGIVEGDGATLAVIRVNGAAPVRVSEGEKIDRWEVAHIFGDRVVLRAAGIEQELRFPAPGAHGTQPAPRGNRPGSRPAG
jgi:general secretion pathway protein N